MSELRLFDAYGIELEYLIVDDDTLSVLPVRTLSRPDAVPMTAGSARARLASHVIWRVRMTRAARLTAAHT